MRESFRRMADSIDEDELRLLVTNRELLHETKESDAIWTRVGEEKNEEMRLDNIDVDDDS